MNDYAEQLKRYAESNAEDAFAAIVHRFLPLVYSAALRRVGGDAHRAQDVAQMVFIAVARNAAQLARHPDLTGWLFTTTRFLATKAMRSEKRRHQREQEATIAEPLAVEGSVEHENVQVHALLDDVLMDLRQIDRQIILLRFHRGLRLAEIGAQLDASENAVQKRLDRALDQLKAKLARRGVTSTAAAVALVLEQQSAVAVPTGLAAASMAAVFAGGAGGGFLAASSLMMISKFQVGLAAAVVIAASSGVVWELRANAHLRGLATERETTLRANVASLEKQIAAQSQRADEAEADAKALRTAISPVALRAVQARARNRELIDQRERWQATVERVGMLRSQGKLQEALQIYVDYYRQLRGPNTGSSVDRQAVMSAIAYFGRVYPPALATLRSFRDEAMQEFQAQPTDRGLAIEVALLNERIGEGRETLALYDSLPANHPARQALGLIAHDAFVAAGRYSDALVGKGFGAMMDELDMGIRSSARLTGQSLSAQKSYVIAGAVSNIEVLAGVGQTAEARTLADKLLSFDGSDSTRAAIKQHMERGGQASTK